MDLNSFLIGLFCGSTVVLFFGMKKFIAMHKELAIFQAERQNLNTSGTTSENEIKTQIQKEFENIALKLLKENSMELSQRNQQDILNILAPFKEKIMEFEKKIDQSRIDEAKDINSLETQIKLLSENNQKICKEANNLATALKGQVKTQGNWGEVILNKLLEISGLQEGFHFTLQGSFKSEEQKMLRPDVIIHLPAERHLIIDSKVSLLSYERYFNNEEDKEKNLKDFIVSTKEHIKNLKSKFYQEISELNSPDFILMFIPVEASFSLLFKEDSEIFEFAWKNKILLVSPSTLLATLKTIELFWQQDKQTKNVIQIAEEGGRLYDKFVGLLTDIESIRHHFDKTQECFDNTRKKLEGKGNLIRQVEKLKELGVKTTKTIPSKFFD